MTLKLRQCSTLHCCSAFNLLWYAFEYALDAGVVLPTWKELVNVSASRVSRISESAVNVWVKEIKSICQVKGQPKIIHPLKSQSKYLVSQAFNQGRRLEYMIYRSATPLNSDGPLGRNLGVTLPYNWNFDELHAGDLTSDLIESAIQASLINKSASPK